MSNEDVPALPDEGTTAHEEGVCLRQVADSMNEVLTRAQTRFAGFQFGVRGAVKMADGRLFVFCKDGRDWRFMVEQTIGDEVISNPLLGSSRATRQEALALLPALFAELVSVCRYTAAKILEEVKKAEAFLASLNP